MTETRQKTILVLSNRDRMARLSWKENSIELAVVNFARSELKKLLEVKGARVPVHHSC